MALIFAEVSSEEQRLRRGVHDEAAVGIGHGDRAVGLGRGVLDRRHLVTVFDDDVGSLECLFDIAVAQLLMVVFAVIFEGVLRIGRINRHSPLLERLLDVEDSRQRVVGDVHQGERLQRRALAGRNDTENGLALVTHDIGRQRRLVILAELDEAQKRVEIDRHVGGPNDALDAGRPRRHRIVDRADARVRVRAAQNFQMEKIREAMIVVIGRRAGDVAENILALRRLADFLEVVVTFIGENVFAQFEHGLSLRRGDGCRCWRRRAPPG
jgi:hypothetical protein